MRAIDKMQFEKPGIAKFATPRDLLDLRAFCLVADMGSLTAAARIMGETAGTVSRRLSRLERELGVTLISRSPRLVKPTESGRNYRAEVRTALERLDAASIAVQHLRASPRGRLRVSAPHGSALGLLAPLMVGFTERFPQIQLEMLLTDEALDIDSYQIDVAFRPASRLRDSSLIVCKLFQYDLRLFASPGYLQRHGLPQNPQGLSRHRMLLRGGPRSSSSSRKLRMVSLRANGDGGEQVTVQPTLCSTDNAFIREAALAGGGIAVLPTVLVEHDVRDRLLVAVLADYKVGSSGALYLLHRATPLVAPQITMFRDYMLQTVAARSQTTAKPLPPEGMPSSSKLRRAGLTRNG
jgi:DNA-binding transcriptional LysR family regulator